MIKLLIQLYIIKFLSHIKLINNNLQNTYKGYWNLTAEINNIISLIDQKIFINLNIFTLEQ